MIPEIRRLASLVALKSLQDWRQVLVLPVSTHSMKRAGASCSAGIVRSTLHPFTQIVVGYTVVKNLLSSASAPNTWPSCQQQRLTRLQSPKSDPSSEDISHIFIQ
jgi:hypothetical protein